ncbi:MAG: alpha/beta hydrolase family protein [Solirubrobacteraceae bacterium]
MPINTDDHDQSGRPLTARTRREPRVRLADAQRARRRRTQRRRRALGFALACGVVGILTAGAIALDGTGGGGGAFGAGGAVSAARGAVSAAALIGGGASGQHAGNGGGGRATQTRPTTSSVPSPSPPIAKPPFAVGIIRLRLVDTNRTAALPGDPTAPRTLITSVRYPAVGPAGSGEHPGAAPYPGAGPYPLIIFGHGFAVTPGIYTRLLDAWAAAGYVVAAPLFPLGNAGAPGGPNENDLPNQPGDMSFVITRLRALDAAPSGPLHGLIARNEIAVSGQSDGGDTALAVAYDPRSLDKRVSAAVILSGAEDPFISGFAIAPGGPPLLATQGTADTINLPSATAAFYDPAPAPKYLLQLPGSSHLPPYTNGQPALGVVERVTIAFLNGYLKHDAAALRRLLVVGNVPGVGVLSADP